MPSVAGVTSEDRNYQMLTKHIIYLAKYSITERNSFSNLEVDERKATRNIPSIKGECHSNSQTRQAST